MQDGFNRQITYARISVTDLCNLRCRYCMPDGVEKKPHTDILSIEELCEVSDALADLGVKKQRITGGEPLVRRGLIGLLEHIGANEKVDNLSMTTNGLLLPQMAQDVYDAGVRNLNISIDTLDEDKYARLTKCGNLKDALAGIDVACEVGFNKIKLNAVLLKGVNEDEIHALAIFAKSKNAEMRFIELMPFEIQGISSNDYFISTENVVKNLKLQKCEKLNPFDKVDKYMFDDGTEVGFISPVSSKFCAYCNRVRITADGKLLNCLHESKEYALREFIGDRAKLVKRIEECVALKPKEHRLAQGELQHREMENIGG